ncbi:MAG: hypothetical protein OEZ06_28705 [Myxococcales bacterium]|nr:hypothetical protein [Myxococcales bacterium]
MIDERLFSLACEQLRVWIGLDLTRGGVDDSIRHHLEKALGELDADGRQLYAAKLTSASSDESRRLIEAATVPHSFLFRDPEQLWELSACIERLPRERPLEVWVPGCANGEDAYSVAMLALAQRREVRILATDVHDSALKRARAGRYNAWSCRHLPERLWCHLARRADGTANVTDALRACVRFQRHSLLDAPPGASGGGRWDVIVCRNVFIYFEPGDVRRLVAQLSAALAPGGLLVLGRSDVCGPLPGSLMPAGEAGRLVLARGASTNASPPPNPEPSTRIDASSLTQRGHELARLARELLVDAARKTEPPPPRAANTAAFATERAPEQPLRALLEQAKRQLADEPDNAEAHLIAGLIDYGEGDYAEAIGYLRAAICLAPGAWAAWLYLGLSFERLGNFTQALCCFRQAGHRDGPGGDLPRGHHELCRFIRGARSDLQRLADRRASMLSNPQ